MTKLQILTAGLFLANLVACSAKVSSDAPAVGPDPGPAIKEQKPSWSADIQGTWTSECIPARIAFDHMAKITVIYDGANFDRTYTEFSDVNCQTQITTDEMKGTFEFTGVAANNVATVSYFTVLPQGGNVREDAFALVDSGALYWSEPGDGNARPLKESLTKLTKVGGAAPTPVPTASPGPGQTASCLSVAGKYQMNSSYIELVQTPRSQVPLQSLVSVKSFYGVGEFLQIPKFST